MLSVGVPQGLLGGPLAIALIPATGGSGWAKLLVGAAVADLEGAEPTPPPLGNGLTPSRYNFTLSHSVFMSQSLCWQDDQRQFNEV